MIKECCCLSRWALPKRWPGKPPPPPDLGFCDFPKPTPHLHRTYPHQHPVQQNDDLRAQLRLHTAPLQAATSGGTNPKQRAEPGGRHSHPIHNNPHPTPARTSRMINTHPQQIRPKAPPPPLLLTLSPRPNKNSISLGEPGTTVRGEHLEAAS